MSWLPSSSEQTSYRYSHHNSANHIAAGCADAFFSASSKNSVTASTSLLPAPYCCCGAGSSSGMACAPASLLVGSGLTCGIGRFRCEADTSGRLQLARYDGIRGQMLHSGQIFSWVVEYCRTSRSNRGTCASPTGVRPDKFRQIFVRRFRPERSKQRPSPVFQLS